jgi:hypothetical protein
MTDMYRGETALLVGGSPLLKKQEDIVSLIGHRNIVSFGINNVASTYKTDYLIAVDNPACLDPAILLDPTITKIMSFSRRDKTIGDSDLKLKHAPAVLFFKKSEVNGNSIKLLEDRTDIESKNNTLVVSLTIIAALGFKNIIITGSDFELKNLETDAHYLSGKKLNDDEVIWNEYLYKTQINLIKSMTPVFKEAGINLYNASYTNKLAPEVPSINHSEIVDLIYKNKPKKFSSDLPHSSKLYDKWHMDDVKRAAHVHISDNLITKHIVNSSISDNTTTTTAAATTTDTNKRNLYETTNKERPRIEGTTKPQKWV